MKIWLEQRNPQGVQVHWVAGRQRLATCTSVRLIDEQTLVCASLAGKAMYLMKFDLSSETHRIIDRIDTVANGATVCTDLLAFDGKDFLATSNCEDSSVSFYRLGKNRVRYETYLKIHGDDGGFCHGVEFVPESDLICAAIQAGSCSFQLWSRTTGKPVARYVDPDWLPKDAVFVAPKTMLALFSSPASAKDIANRLASKLALIEFSADLQVHAVRGEWVLQDSQFDCVVYSNGLVFLTNQGHDQVTCYKLAEPLEKIRSFDGYSFPHGVDFDPVHGVLAVTNYGDNSIDLRVVRLAAG